jgi:hypothetical protein
LIGDLTEEYGEVNNRFNKRRADMVLQAGFRFSLAVTSSWCFGLARPDLAAIDFLK